MLAGNGAASPTRCGTAPGDAAARAPAKHRPPKATARRRRESVALSRFHPAAALRNPSTPAGAGRLGPRDQIRWLSRATAGRRRKVSLKTRKGLDWTEKFNAIAKEAAALPRCIIDGEIVALDHNGAPDFAALQAALSEQKTDDLIFYAFDLLFEDARSSPNPALRAQDPAAGPSGSEDTATARSSAMSSISRPGAMRCCGRPAGCLLKASFQSSLDAPYRSGRTNSWTKAKCRAGHEVVIGGWTTTNGKFRSLLAGVHRGDHFVYLGRVGTGYARHNRTSAAAAEGGRERQIAFHRHRSAARRTPPSIGPARTRCRNRIRRLDRGRHGPPSGVQGVARGQARRRRSRPRTPAPAEKTRGAAPEPSNRRSPAGAKPGENANRSSWESSSPIRTNRSGRMPATAACDQARSRPLLRNGRILDDRSSRGAPLFDHSRAGRPWRRAVLSASRHAGNVEPSRTRDCFRRPQALPPDRSRRGARGGCPVWRRSNSIRGTASQSSPRFRGGWCSTSIPVPMLPFPTSSRPPRKCATGWPSSALSAFARPPAARACTW